MSSKWSKIGWIVAGLFLVFFVILPLVISVRHSLRKPLYCGQTKLMPSATSDKRWKELSNRANLTKLVNLAQSKDVLKTTVVKLSQKGIVVTSNDLRENLSVQIVKDTNVIAVDVINPDPNTAVAIADAVADVLKAAYDKKNSGACLKTIDPAYLQTVDQGWF